MSAMADQTDSTTKRPSAGQDACQGESKKAAVEPCTSREHLPSRRGIIVDLMVDSADKFVGFMGQAAGAEEYFRFAGDNGKVMHLALDIGGVAAYVEELGNDMDTSAIAKPHVQLHLNTDDPLSMSKKLVDAGAKELKKCEKQFWGALYGQYLDPVGQIWSVSNSTKDLHDVPPELARKIIPFVSVRDCAAYMTFLTTAFGAEVVYPPAKDPTGKIMCAEMKIDGGIIMLGDHCGEDADKEEASVTVFYEVAAGKAAPLSKAFQANGGEIIEEPTMRFWGQVWGRCKDVFGQPWGLCEVQAGPTPSEEEMSVDMKIGAKHDWKYTWTEEDVPKMHCFGEARSCVAKGPFIAEQMKTMLPAAFAAAAKAGAAPVGPPMSVYITWECDGDTKFTCGPAVSAEAAAASAPEGDGLGVREAGGCKCVTVVHVGPYEDMMKTYTATFEWVEAKGYEYRLPVVEVYQNDPKEVEPAKLRTKLYIPIVPKGTPKA